MQLRLERAQLWSREGRGEEGAVLSCTDQEAPAVSDLPAAIHVGQNEGEGLPEEERTRFAFAHWTLDMEGGQLQGVLGGCSGGAKGQGSCRLVVRIITPAIY